MLLLEVSQHERRNNIVYAEQEAREELKVLAALTVAVASQARTIFESLDAATQLDLARARAKHAEYGTLCIMASKLDAQESRNLHVPPSGMWNVLSS